MAAASLSFQPRTLSPNATIHTPLSRLGRGPGLLLLVPESYQGRSRASAAGKTLDPEPLQKWAEEGFGVVAVRVGDQATLRNDCIEGIRALKGLPQCLEYPKIGIVAYDSDTSPLQVDGIWQYLSVNEHVAAIVTFAKDNVRRPTPNEPTTKTPLMTHTTGQSLTEIKGDVAHSYQDVLSTGFVLPGHEHYLAGPAALAHTRSLGFLKKHLGGPNFDLEKIWDEHTYFEFEARDVEKTMNTMVEEPYVNHIPTLTGGIGRAALSAFYRDHFVFNNPPDTKMELVSRTVGIDRVIDEFIFSFTHTKMIDWLIPGIPPTNQPVSVPFTSVVNIRGDRLYHEHIAWDQASVLRQLGLLPEYLPFPYPLPDGRTPAKGKRFEYRVPTAGADTANKLRDENCVKSNEMFGFEVREVDDL